MHELRWTLLLLGVLFVAVLALWEQRRARHRAGVDSRSGERAESAHAGAASREPAVPLPELHAREPVAPAELPVLEVAPDSPLAMHFETGLGEEEATPPPRGARREPVLSDEAFGEAGPDAPLPTLGSEPGTLRVADHQVSEWEIDTAEDEESGPREPEAQEAEAQEAEAQEAEAHEPAGQGRAEDAEHEPTGSETPPRAAAHGPLASRDFAPATPAAAASAEPIVDWPPEDERQILALRIACAGPERFAGRALRQALAGEGFVHGKFSIFHKPAGDRRAFLSAASLTRPGTFDLATMDLQRYGGLSIFAVLPGPRTPADTLEELLSSARRLNERLQGALQDERGGPLTPVRIAQLRESVQSEGPA